jgi:hypothetical protein
MPDLSHLSCVHSVPAMVKKILLTLTLALPLLTHAAPLDDRITAFKSAATQNEPAVSEILQLGLTENRSALAFAAVKPWLAQNEANSVKFLFLAAQSAEFAGEWRQAVSFYRKLLKSPDIDASTAAIAAPSCYRLLINHLGDADSAYLLMREEGLRLRNFGNNRQFDAWFLAKTAERKDLASTAKWLVAIYQSDEPREAYEPVLTALLGDLETYTYNQPQLLAELKALAAAKNTTPVNKARMEWIIAVVPFAYEAAELLNAKKPVPEALADAPLQAAKQLIAVSPYEGSLAVASGWMHFSAGDSGFFATFTNPRRAEKAAPLLAALKTLPIEEAQSVLDLQVPFAKNRNIIPYLLSDDEVKALVAARTELEAPHREKNRSECSQRSGIGLLPRADRSPTQRRSRHRRSRSQNRPRSRRQSSRNASRPRPATSRQTAHVVGSCAPIRLFTLQPASTHRRLPVETRL